MAHKIVMPRAGLTMVEGTVSLWMVDEGSCVNKGDIVMEFENEKNVIECEAFDPGIIHIIAEEGETVPVGGVIAYLAEDEAEYEMLLSSPIETEPETCPSAPPEAVPKDAQEPETRSAASRVSATGYARKLAGESGIDIKTVTPSGGPGGNRITWADVKKQLEKIPAVSPVTSESLISEVNDEICDIPWTGMHKTIADNMYRSIHKAAPAWNCCDFDVTDLVAMKKHLSECSEKLGYKVSFNDLLCKLLGKVLVGHPYMNATYDGETVHSYKHVNLAVGVATEGGLQVPVIRHIDEMSLEEINHKIRDLSARAKERKLLPDEQSGGSATITNIGMFPMDSGGAIMNGDQVAIYGFGRIRLEPVYMPDGSLAPRSIMNMFISYDHRVGDGMLCARIYEDVQYYLKHPELLLL